MFHLTKQTTDNYVESLKELLTPKLLKNKFIKFLKIFSDKADEITNENDKCISKIIENVGCRFYDVEYVKNFIVKSVKEREEVVRRRTKD